MKVTIQDILDMNPCLEYTKERLTELFDGKKTISEKGVFELPISHEDKVWVIGRMLPWADNFVLPASVTHLRVYNCDKLTELNVPASVTELWVYNCDKLTELNVPASVTDLWVDNCDKLENQSR